MNGAFHVGAVGLEAQQRALDTIAGNISNINTVAFKRSDVRFSEVLATGVDAAARGDAGAGNASAGVRAEAAPMIDNPGRVQRTGNAMDLAIEGRGFLEVMGPAGQTLLWRGGALSIGEGGLLSTASGLPLKAALSVPHDASAIEVGPDGIVRVKTGDAGEAVEIGQLMLVKSDNPSALTRLDGGYYRAADETRLTEAAPGEDGVGTFVQGALEGSNVDLASEMVQLLLIQRAYGANAQVVQAADQLMGLANGLRR